jgi:pyrroline-5-carboxylate reductase
MKTDKIGFIGGGNMASSLLNGLCASGHAPAQLWVTDINTDASTALGAKLAVNVAADNIALVDAVDVVVLAVKPQVLKAVASAIASQVQARQTLVISIAAGISQAQLSAWLGVDTAIVRCMPNTPALVLTGATALHANACVTADQRNLAENIMRSVGIALWVEDEGDLNAVTAVSGSGPAYFFLLMEAMENAAVAMGLDAEMARLLVQQTALGAAKIALESAESPGQLRQRVTSPGGTTEQAIKTFEQGDFSGLVTKALLAAHERSAVLAKQSEEA